MIFELFLIGVVFGAICLFLGYSQQSFPFAYLGMFIFLVLGLFLMQEGLAMQSGTVETPFGSHNFINVYTTYTTTNNSIVGVIAATFFYIPFAGIVLSTLLTLRGWRR